MFLHNTLSLFGLLWLRLAHAAPTVERASPRGGDHIYDAIVIGGGPSGLAALSGLARVRRDVLLIDSGEYRNNATRHMHDVIGLDGKLCPLGWYAELHVLTIP